MKKPLLLLPVICIAAIAFVGLHRHAVQMLTTTTAETMELNALTKQLAEDQKTNAILRGEVQAKQNHLRMVARHPGITPELLALVEKNFTGGSPAEWAQLRRQLGIGWNSSPDYVLVDKRSLKNLSYDKFRDASGVTAAARDLLSLSSAEKSALEAALKQAKNTWTGLQFQRDEPSGDIVAQYTVSMPGPEAELSLSNTFASGLAAAVGAERSDLLLPGGWYEFKSQLGTDQAGTMTIRQITVDGQPDLVCEMKLENQSYSSPVRYANYPSGWFLTYFPGGWETLAQRENFQLPAAFHKQE